SDRDWSSDVCSSDLAPSPISGKASPSSQGSTKGAPQCQHANQQRRTGGACPFAETAPRCPPSFDGANREQCHSENFARPVNHPVRDKSQFASRRAISAL